MELTIHDFTNELFPGDPRQKFESKKILKDDDSIDRIIEGVTLSDNAHEIKVIYNVSSRKVKLLYFDSKKNKDVVLLKKTIESQEGFYKAIHKAEEKIYEYLSKN